MTTSEEIQLLCLGVSLAVRLGPRALRPPAPSRSPANDDSASDHAADPLRLDEMASLPLAETVPLRQD